MLIFQNSGEIDPKLVTTFGVNVKPSSQGNPIGFFGTGLKYAIAVTLRLGGSVTIQSGLKTYAFSISRRELRGKDFEIITMNRRALAFTTEVGKTWEPWMAYREFFCNAKDEPEHQVWLGDSVPLPEAGLTRIIVEGLDFIHGERHKYFLESTSLHRVPGLEVHPTASDTIYYHGIAVSKLQHPSLFTYNLTNQQRLTEDRMLSSQWDFIWHVKAMICELTDKSLLETLLSAPESTLEGELNYTDSRPTEEFLEVALALRARKAHVNPTALAAARIARPEHFVPAVAKLGPVQRAQLARAVEFLGELGFTVTQEIRVVESLGKGVLGQALGQLILLSFLAFEKGTKCVAGTILEEHIHIQHNVFDCSRDMQDLLLDKMMSLGEMLLGEPL